MAFYYGDECLGETSAEVVGKLDYGDHRAIVYDYLTRDFTLEDLATFILDREDASAIRDLAEEALENLDAWAENGQNFCYGGVECIKDDGSPNRRPKASQYRSNGTAGKKAPAKKTTKSKASGKRSTSGKPAKRRS